MSYLDDFWSNRKAPREQRGKKTHEQIQKEDEQLVEVQRQKVISFKRFFGEEHGRAVMLDLMNRYHILTPLPQTSDPLALARAEGERDVVLYLLSRANTDMAQLDKILKGEF